MKSIQLLNLCVIFNNPFGYPVGSYPNFEEQLTSHLLKNAKANLTSSHMAILQISCKKLLSQLMGSAPYYHPCFTQQIVEIQTFHPPKEDLECSDFNQSLVQAEIPQFQMARRMPHCGLAIYSKM
jgi:hypothetical protein